MDHALIGLDRVLETADLDLGAGEAAQNLDILRIVGKRRAARVDIAERGGGAAFGGRQGPGRTGAAQQEGGGNKG